MLIAAHALSLDCTFVTDNVREFERVVGLKLENWLDDPAWPGRRQAGSFSHSPVLTSTADSSCAGPCDITPCGAAGVPDQKCATYAAGCADHAVR